MNGPLAQVVALTAHVNAAIDGIPFPPFFPNHFTAAFCEWIEFGTLTRDSDDTPLFVTLAPDPASWLEWLEARQCTGAWLTWHAENPEIAPDRMLAGFVGGGGRWQILTPTDEGLLGWVAGWRIGNREAQNRRIWQVGYALAGVVPGDSLPSDDFPRARDALRRALEEIHAFAAARPYLDQFTESFAMALSLVGGKTRPRGPNELAPEGVFTDAEQGVLDACQAAWVFGGMGSWNDLGFDPEEQPEYDRVSENLFQAINAAIPAVTTGPTLRRARGSR